MEYEFENKVLEFAKQAHGEQKRKYTGEPYWHHLVEVAEIVKTVPHTQQMAYAAYLHDIIEDTLTSKSELYNTLVEIGLSYESAESVVNYVLGLTDVSRPEYGNRAFRKEMDRNHLSKQPDNVKTIKLADMISNTKSIIEHDKKFAAVYIPEKIELLKVLKEGDFDLYMRACYEVYKAKLMLSAEGVK